MNKIENHPVALARVLALDLRAVKFALTLKKSGPRWTREQAEAAEFDYKRFLYLIAKHPGLALVPTEGIDVFWHHHILDTRKYAQDCADLFGEYLHHFPYFGECGDEDAAALSARFDMTVALFEREFGSRPSTMTRPVEAGALCGITSQSSDWADNRRIVGSLYQAFVSDHRLGVRH